MRSIPETTDMLVRWCDERGISSGIDEFISYLSDISSEYLLPHILNELGAREAETSFYEKLHVTSAQNLSDEKATSLQKGFDVSSSQTELQTNKKLLAGVSCEHDGVQIKDNLHGRLQALQNRLYIN